MTTLQLTLPDEVKNKVAEVAERQHVTLQAFMTMALMEKLSSIPDPDMEDRAARSDQKDFDEFLASIPDVPPDAHDRLD
jgi:predicted transcriptional regulator